MVLFVSEFRPDSCVVAEVRASPNHGERNGNMKPDILVLHYTGMSDAQDAVRRLCSESSKVSSHYIVLEDGHIIQSVAESRRAWHAGESSWAGETDLNSRSIGIEIANPGHDHGYPEFPRRQIAAVTALCRSIFTRHRIPADRVVAHSDIAPSRKKDPGEKFPWKSLHDSGIGLWIKPVPVVPNGPIFVLGDSNPAIKELQELFARYGYGVLATGQFDSVTHDVITAFQRHFRPAKVDGIADVSTIETLRTLLHARDGVTGA
jgi:N-acetylmuramoyl-L-alanine amidase